MKRVLDATSPYDRRPPTRDERSIRSAAPAVAPTRGVPMEGSIRLAFDARSGGTRLVDLYQQAPLRAFFPRNGSIDEPEAVLANVAGGLVGGDRLSAQISSSDGAHALITSQAAEKIYRSAGPEVGVDCEIAVSGGASLAWMPQPTILFDGAVLRRSTRISFEPGAQVHAGEVVAFGRAGSGERLASGQLSDIWEVRRSGRLIWTDRMAVDDWPAVRDHPACFAGARASALFLHGGDDAADGLETARAIIGQTPDGLMTGATVIDGLLIVRWLGRDAKALLDAYTDFWRRYRTTGRVPRIWAI
jgi:urease accessory protein